MSYKTKLGVMVSFFLILTACSFGDNLGNMNENRAISKMKAEAENQYHLFTFWSEESQTYLETFDYSNVDLNTVRLIASYQQEHEFVKALKINEFPTFIVLDHQGIVLRTTDVNEINEFLKQYQME